MGYGTTRRPQSSASAEFFGAAPSSEQATFFCFIGRTQREKVEPLMRSCSIYRLILSDDLCLNISVSGCGTSESLICNLVTTYTLHVYVLTGSLCVHTTYIRIDPPECHYTHQTLFSLWHIPINVRLFPFFFCCWCCIGWPPVKRHYLCSMVFEAVLCRIDFLLLLPLFPSTMRLRS